KPKISKLHPRGHDSDLIPRRLRPASSQASAKNFYKSKRGCSIANMLISIGSDNLDAQFREVLLHRRGKVSVGELCSAYGIRWCRCTTLTVRLVRNARLTRTSADVSVGVLDWDSNRFLEAFFAIPMMGAVLQTVNVRLSPEQIAYTIDHAGASTLLVNDEFVELVHSILPRLSKVKQVVILSDRQAPTTGQLGFVGEYEELLAAASPDYEFPD